METFEFEIVEFEIVGTSVRTAKLEAESVEDARERLKNAYKNEGIVLDASDWVDTRIIPEDGEYYSINNKN